MPRTIWPAIRYGVVLNAARHRQLVGKTQAPRPWTCGQRAALLRGSTASATATIDLNETRIVLPMPPVKPVTYVSGCSMAPHPPHRQGSMKFETESELTLPPCAITLYPLPLALGWC